MVGVTFHKRLAGALVLAASVARAQVPVLQAPNESPTSREASSSEASPDIDAAREAFREGVEEARQQRFDAAARAFERSLELVPHAATHYNLAQAYLAENRLLAVRSQLLRARARAADGTGELSPEQLATVQRLLTDMERRLVRVQVASKGQARVSVDGRVPTPLEQSKLGELAVDVWSAPGHAWVEGDFVLVVEPGRHAIVVEQGGVAVSFALDEAEGARRSFAVTPTPAAEPTTTSSAPREALRSPQPPRSGPSPLALGGFGVAAVGAVSAAIFGVLALRAQSELDAACPAREACPAGSDRLRARLTRWSILTDVSLGVSLVGVGVGAYVTLSPASGARPMQASVSGTF